MQSIASFLTLPIQETKELSSREKKWAIQREVFALMEDEVGLKMYNWKRFIEFLKKYKIAFRGGNQKDSIKRWKATSKIKWDADVRPIKPMNKSSFGFFTNHLDEDAMWYLLSVCKDRRNRGECVTTYILSLQKFSTE